MSKEDDLSRRKTKMVVQLAKEANDPLYHKAVMYRHKEKECIAKMKQKYGTKGEKLAKESQRKYLHPASDKKILPASFMKAGGNERVDDSKEGK